MLVISVLKRMTPERDSPVEVHLLLGVIVSLLLLLFHEQTVRAFLVVKFAEVPATFGQLHVVLLLLD